MNRHIHIDVGGGIAGNIFIAAILSAFPEAQTELEQDWHDAGIDKYVKLHKKDVIEKGFAALRVNLLTLKDAPKTHHWRDIKKTLLQSALREPVKAGAISIFTELAKAEAICHGIHIDDVHFHEIADWDSLADIIGAASLVDYIKAQSWTLSALPLGRGVIKTKHGNLPIPAPATAQLLKGFHFIDDGGMGERITPTGAAILKFLNPDQVLTGIRGELNQIGIGAGDLEIEGIPNILRLLCFEKKPIKGEWVHLIRFEIDDMTPEEIAVSLDHIRQIKGVLDASYVVGMGKKARTQFSFSIMTRPEHNDQVIAACFNETSTIGLRVEQIMRHTLERKSEIIDKINRKTVSRPHGTTSKAESDDLATIKTLKARRLHASAREKNNHE